jgi:AraC-like DNA-binding protein
MVREVRRYGRWLRDNYADLEHKEVWQSFAVLAIVLLVFGIYAFIYEGLAYLYAMQVIGAMFICYLLWRVETLSDLSIPLSQNLSVAEPAITEAEDVEGTGLSQTNLDRQTLVAMPAKNVEALLQQHCIDTQLYLQHDLTIIQLAKAIGTNRTYLSQYFISKDTTYNAYINNLRINHFVSLYREAVATQRSVSAKQLASDSGYRSYSTFALAFKQRMGQPVMAWMRDFAV